jgi:subtilisin family serine protease
MKIKPADSRYNRETTRGQVSTDVRFALDASLYDALDRTIFVGSFDMAQDDLAFYFVSAGDAASHFIVADGTNILDTGIGTSYAAPRVTGTIALLGQKFPNLTPQGSKGVLLDTAIDLGAAGVDPVYGHGLLDVKRALNPIGLLK